MGNTSRMKKVLAIVLAATCMLVFSFSSVFAATGSPTAGKAEGKVTGEYQTTVKSTASLIKVIKKNTKTKAIPNVLTSDGVAYKIVAIDKGAFKNAKKLKKINVKGVNLKTVNKQAFKGLKKSQVKKIVVKISKKNKNYKKLKKQFIAAGIKKSNIKFY